MPNRRSPLLSDPAPSSGTPQDVGRREGRIRDDVDIRDVILFGAMLITPLSGAPEWDAIARRQKAIHIDGLTLRPPHSGDAPEGPRPPR